MASFFMGVQSAVIAFFMGLIPILIWLAFWLSEDLKRPEPKKLIFLAFISGMAGVLLVLPFQQLASTFLDMGFPLILTWAAMEEVTKTFMGWLTVLRRKELDEPVDFPIYLITISLGFAALENAFFLFHPVTDGHFFESFINGNLRFIGSTLVHVLSSAMIGGALAFAYYREWPEKLLYGSVGVILAIGLHALFNFLIISTGSSGILTVFLGVWVGIIFLLLSFERIKNIHRPLWWEKVFMKEIN